VATKKGETHPDFLVVVVVVVVVVVLFTAVLDPAGINLK
jgi:preprotein translocase subunit SecE